MYTHPSLRPPLPPEKPRPGELGRHAAASRCLCRPGAASVSAAVSVHSAASSLSRFHKRVLHLCISVPATQIVPPET